MNKLYKFKDGKRIKALVDITCPVCKEKFSPSTSKSKYCSKTCYYEMKRIRGDRCIWTDEMKKTISKRYMGSGNPNFGKTSPMSGKKRPEFSGEKHPNWKRGYWISKDGYKYYESVYTKGKKITEHRMIMEKYLGRKLLNTEIIHHINGDVIDNSIDNLMICTRAKHINIHRKDLERGKKVK
jgi:hypothetical protein